MAKIKTVILRALSLGVAALFLYAGGSKLLHPGEFLLDVESYELVPYRLSYMATFFVPALEVVAGAGVLFAGIRRESAMLLLGLTTIFVFALASAWVRGLDISCGCFGASGQSANYPLLIGRDILIAVACVLIIRLQCRWTQAQDYNTAATENTA